MEISGRFVGGVLRVFVVAELTLVVYCASRSKMSGESVSSDASDVTWAHAVNSRAELEKALSASVDFLEADISLGHVIGNEQVFPIPIMAHPPETTSDISLDSWLNTVLTRRPEKGLKLDFKSIEVVEPSLVTLQKYSSKLKGPLWLSADVLPGPVHSKLTILRSDYFLALCSRYFPRATISLGWKTYWNRRLPIDSWQYQWKHVRQMADVVRCWYEGRKYPPITFSVRGLFASRSIKQLQWLLNTVPGSTLTVWSGRGDSVNAEDFLRVQKSFPIEKVYFDVSGSLYKPSSKFKANSVPKKKTYADSASKWVSVTRSQDKTCEAHSYIDDDFILFGRPSNSAVLQRNLVLVDDVDDSSTNFSMTARLKFFAGEHALNPAHWEHKLKVVLADASKLSKHAATYSKKKLAISVKDPELLWSVVNSSALYTFEHQYFQDSTACRMFKLDVSGSDLSFEAWTIPCDATYEVDSYDEVAERSIPEVSLEESLSEDREKRMFVLGFHSYGEEYVLVYDLHVSGLERELKSNVDPPPQLTLALTSVGTKLNGSFIFLVTAIVLTRFCCYRCCR